MTRRMISLWYNVNLSMKDPTYNHPMNFLLLPACLLVETKLDFSSHRMCGYFLLILPALHCATYLNRLDLNMKQPLVLGFTNIRQIPLTVNQSSQVVFSLPSWSRTNQAKWFCVNKKKHRNIFFFLICLLINIEINSSRKHVSISCCR